ncbi:MAG: DsrE family protein [Rhodospirillales bacterium]|nr:DsrE family protein [Rhodospirillales bacterium]
MVRTILAVFALLTFLMTGPVSADAGGSLFVNLTSDENHRADMAMGFAKAMMERGHPLTVWLNDKGVLLASREHAGTFAEQQKMLAELMTRGATVIVCPMCMKHYGVKDGDLIEGVKVGNPDMTSGLLFKDGTQTLTW